jgi:hypothetical protein
MQLAEKQKRRVQKLVGDDRLNSVMGGGAFFIGFYSSNLLLRKDDKKRQY